LILICGEFCWLNLQWNLAIKLYILSRITLTFPPAPIFEMMR